jgi:hypothetical protein
VKQCFSSLPLFQILQRLGKAGLLEEVRETAWQDGLQPMMLAREQLGDLLECRKMARRVHITKIMVRDEVEPALKQGVESAEFGVHSLLSTPADQPGQGCLRFPLTRSQGRAHHEQLAHIFRGQQADKATGDGVDDGQGGAV